MARVRSAELPLLEVKEGAGQGSADATEPRVRERPWCLSLGLRWPGRAVAVSRARPSSPMKQVPPAVAVSCPERACDGSTTANRFDRRRPAPSAPRPTRLGALATSGPKPWSAWSPWHARSASLLTQPSAAREPCGRGRQRGRARVWASSAGATRRLGEGPGKGRTSGEGFGQGPVRTGKAQSCHSGRRGRAHQAHDDQCRKNAPQAAAHVAPAESTRKSGPADRVAPLRRTALGGRRLPHLAAEVEPVPGALTPADRSWGRASARTPNGPRRAQSAASTADNGQDGLLHRVSPTSSRPNTARFRWTSSSAGLEASIRRRGLRL
jgi:hypothetical protein